VTGTSDNPHRLHLEEISEKLLFPSSGKEGTGIYIGEQNEIFSPPWEN
jgi:hypothetical protein